MTDVAYTFPETLTAEPVAQTAVLSRICVRPPYFALHHLRLEDDLFVAEAQAELPRGLTLAPMRPGDLSRHGAIAGLCAVALRQRDDQRRYYLATRATFTGHPSSAPYGAPLRFEAAVTELGKRDARALVTAYHHDERVAVLDVGYSVLSATLFERLNAPRRQPTRRGAFAPLAAQDVLWQGNTGVLRIPALPVELCAGHFDGFPAAPVALLMDQLAGLGERLVGHPCHPAWGEIRADRLVWAGDEVVFRVTRTGGSPRETQLEGEITSSGEPVGQATFTLHH